jgi:hypothetical protein
MGKKRAAVMIEDGESSKRITPVSERRGGVSSVPKMRMEVVPAFLFSR